VIAGADHDVALAGQRFHVGSGFDSLRARRQGMENIQQVSDDPHNIKLGRMPLNPFEPIQILTEPCDQQKAHRFV
jgi:hypothetical protein